MFINAIVRYNRTGFFRGWGEGVRTRAEQELTWQKVKFFKVLIILVCNRSYYKVTCHRNFTDEKLDRDFHKTL